MPSLESILHPSLRDTGGPNGQPALALPLELEYWIDAGGDEGGSGTEDDPWGPIEGLEAARLLTLEYARIAQCLIHVLGAGDVRGPAQPFDGGAFGGNGSLGLVGGDVVELAAGLEAGAGSTTTRLVLSTAVPGGLGQYAGRTIEWVSGTAGGVGDRKVIRGHQDKDDCRFATTGNVVLSGAQAVDGGSPSNGDRILVPLQTNPVENGIYLYNTAGAWTRAQDADSAQELDDACVLVTSGDTLAGTRWYQHTASPTVGSSAITWSQDDIVLVPCGRFDAAPQAGDTFRVTRPAARVVNPVSPSGIALARGFASSARNQFADRQTGLYLANLAFDELDVENSTVQLHGVEADEVQLKACTTWAGRQGTSATNTLAWLGAPRYSAWEGWGLRVSGGFFQVADGGFFLGFVVALGLSSIQVSVGNPECVIWISGGRIESTAFRMRVGQLLFQGFTTPTLMISSSVIAQGHAYAHFNDGGGGVVFSKHTTPALPGRGLITAIEHARVLIRGGGAFGHSNVQPALDTTAGGSEAGGRILFRGALTLTGAGGVDARVHGSAVAASHFSAIGTGISDATGAVIARVA